MPRTLDVKAAVLAGIIAGILFIMLEMALVALLQGMSPWGPPRMMAAIVMGREVLPPPASFDAGIMAVAMLIHLALSIVMGLIFAFAASTARLGLLAAIIAGTVFGLAVYVVDFYLFTEAFSWFEMGRGPINIFAHAVFGAVLGGVYHALSGRSGEQTTDSAAHRRADHARM